MDWLWTKALKSAAKRVVQVVVAYVGQAQTQVFLNSIGVQVSIDPVVATPAMYGALEFLRSFLKVKAGLKFL